jgi:hypothetical protein
MDFKPSIRGKLSKLQKVEALYLRATTEGEKEAARLTMLKLKQKYSYVHKYQKPVVKKYEYTVFDKV